jgi:KDO2-lipid IV(A) lauroyltransferase
MARNKKFQHQIEWATVRVARALLSVLPLRVATGIGAMAGWKAYRIFGVRRRVSIDNIMNSLPAVTSEREADRIACASYMNFGRSMIEFGRFNSLTPDEVKEIVQFGGLQNVEAALEKGNGAILFSGHLGNFELLGAAISAHGYPLKMLVGQQSNSSVDDEIVKLRSRHCDGIIRREEAPKAIFRALAKNSCVAMVADQDARDSGVFVDFLGRPASTARGPAVFAIRRQAPVVPAFIRRIGGGRHHAEFLPPMYPDPGLKGDDAVVELVQRYTDALADAVRRHPEEYFWAHRRWKTSPG